MRVLLLIAQLAAADVPCTVPVPENSGEWKQVTAPGVIFCVPASWRVRGTRASYTGGSVRWQNSAPPAMTRQAGGVQSIGGRGSSPDASAPRTERLPEMIGGNQAEIWRQMGVGRLQTGVSWRQPLFSMVGEAAGEEHVLTQMAVYRTVRFTGSGGS